MAEQDGTTRIRRCNKLTQRRLKALLNYDPQTGKFTWRVTVSAQSVAGTRAGNLDDGRWRIRIDGRMHRANRLAWLYVTGESPPDEIDIDHRNRDPSDDSWENLRWSTHSQNGANSKRWKGKELPKGVSRLGRRYRARISVKGNCLALGIHATVEDAAAAYAKAARTHFGRFGEGDQ